MAVIFEKKQEISKIRLRHVLSWPQLSLEPQCHDSLKIKISKIKKKKIIKKPNYDDPGTFGDFGKQITDKQTD